ncbi:hypothetical protein HDV64DRAFT_214039 [Trichoderma sp. TUCIM 5745]
MAQMHGQRREGGKTNFWTKRGALEWRLLNFNCFFGTVRYCPFVVSDLSPFFSFFLPSSFISLALLLLFFISRRWIYGWRLLFALLVRRPADSYLILNFFSHSPLTSVSLLVVFFLFCPFSNLLLFSLTSCSIFRNKMYSACVAISCVPYQCN